MVKKMSKYKVCFEVNNKNVIIGNIEQANQHDAILAARQRLTYMGDDVPRFKWCQESK